MVVTLLWYLCTAIRGEEVTLLSLKIILDLQNQTWQNPTPRVMLTFRGIFKGFPVDRNHMLSIVDENCLKVMVRWWFSQCFEQRYFQRAKGRRANCSNYYEMIKNYLIQVHREKKVYNPREIEPFEGYELLEVNQNIIDFISQ